MKIGLSNPSCPPVQRLRTWVRDSQRLAGAALCASLLAACTGTTQESSSSQDQSSSATVASSSSAAQLSSSSSVAVSSSSVASLSSIASSSSQSSMPVSSSSQASSSVPVQTQFTDFIANATSGADIYSAQCFVCHGDKGAGSKEIDLTNYPSDAGLHSYVETFMPKIIGNLSPASCVGQCAADVTAYMATWRKAEEAACSAERSVLYGERSLKLLTEKEYSNSLRDLFPNKTVPSEFLGSLPDIKIGKFPNHFDAVVISGRARQFMTNAEGIADWAVQGNHLGSCDDLNACANNFINDFAYRAYRRPLTAGPSEAENEIAQFKDLFKQAPTPKDGLRWAIVTVLTSPNFLYRSELGIPVKQAIEEGFGAAAAIEVVTPTGTYVTDGEGVTINGIHFANKSQGFTLKDGYGYNMTRNGDLRQRFQYDKPAIITVRAKGNDKDGQWPRMKVIVNQKEMGTVMVNSYDEQVFNFLFDGQAGEHDLIIRFDNEAGGGQPENAIGKDMDLYIGNVTVGPAKKQDTQNTDQTEGDLAALALADPNAYVLTPYEYAAAISYMYTGSTPDALLMAAAKSGDINKPEEVVKHIDRLLQTNAAKEHIKTFANFWLRTDRMLDVNFIRENPKFTPTIRDAMIEELRTTFWNVFNNDNVPFSEMYDANYIFANKALADFYGVGWPGGNENEFVKITTSERGGLPTMGAFLANWAHPKETSPILRAVNVRENMLCHHIDPPPQTNIAEREELANTVNALAESGTLTTREYYRLITTHPQCDSCHLHDINPLGFGLESFDNVGLPRTHQLDSGEKGNLLNVDSEGTLFGSVVFKDNADAHSFNGPKALGNILANSQAAQACLTEKIFRMVVGRPVKNSARDQLTTERELTAAETLDYGCAAEKLNDTLQNNNQSPKAMFKALGNLDLIRFRR